MFFLVVYVRCLHSVQASWIVGRFSTLAIVPTRRSWSSGPGADGPATLADGEALADLGAMGVIEVDAHLDVVAGHDHLGPVGQPMAPVTSVVRR